MDNPRLGSSIDQLHDRQARIEQRKNQEAVEQLDLFLANNTCLPNQREVPNAFLRGALFPAIGKNSSKQMLTRERIASLEGVEIIYTGQRLNQDHLTVWCNLIHLMKAKKTGHKFTFKGGEYFALTNKSDGGKNYEVLLVQLSQLQATTVEIQQGSYVYSGSFISEAARDNETKQFSIDLNPRLVALFEPNHFTRMNWLIREELQRKALALWLMGFYSSHSEPYAYKIESIMHLSGSEASSPKDFAKTTLKRALSAVQQASEKYGKKFFFEVKNGKLSVSKSKPFLS